MGCASTGISVELNEEASSSSSLIPVLKLIFLSVIETLEFSFAVALVEAGIPIVTFYGLSRPADCLLASVSSAFLPTFVLAGTCRLDDRFLSRNFSWNLICLIGTYLFCALQRTFILSMSSLNLGTWSKYRDCTP